MVETGGTAKRQLWIATALMALVVSSMKGETTASASGIEGTVMISPIHGGPSRLGVADSAPMPNTNFFVETAAGKVATFKTDQQGNFKVELPPGRYAIRIQNPKIKGRGCGLTDIEVSAGSFKKVRLDCDSGMR